MAKRHKPKNLAVRVAVLPIGSGLMLGALFAMALNSVVAGAAVGLVIAAAFAGFLYIAETHSAPKTRK